MSHTPEHEKAGLLGSSAEWGNIQDVVNAPLDDVSWSASWLSVILMWLTIPVSLIQGIFVGLCRCCLVTAAIGSNWIPCSASCCSAIGSVKSGGSFLMAWVWWRYMVGLLLALVANGKSRLALFIWEWEAFGAGRYWWHGEGLWMWTYKDCQKILKSQQRRKSAFGSVQACTPDLFATNILIFLSNEGSESEWAAVRRALHLQFTDHESTTYTDRINTLRSKVSEDWPNPQLKDLQNVELLQRTVAKCIFYMMFSVWLKDDEATTLTGWRTEAAQFILPRLVHRFLFNMGIKKVKALRVKTVELVQKYNLQEDFIRMNNSMPAKWQRRTVVKLCDEIMYVVGFAGIGGTCAAVESCASFLQCQTPFESASKHIKWGAFDTTEKMQAQFIIDQDTYIREVLRMNPPVTSATGVLKETVNAMMAGREVTVDENTCNQYTLSMANRDTDVFPEPEVFKPDRANLNSAFTWNGTFGAEDEAEYPRICPGRWMSIDIVTVIISHALGMAETNLGRGAAQKRGFGLC